MATDNLLTTDIVSAVIQSGEGVPNHIGIKGTIYVDRNTGISYQNIDGIYTWEQFAYLSNLTGGTGTISGSGSLNSIPKWSSVSALTNSNISDNGSLITLSSNVSIIGSLSAMTYYGNGSNITGIPYTTGGTYTAGVSGGTLTFRNTTGGTFNVSGASFIESNSNKQNSMTIDNTGVKYPTVDAVNIQANNLARATTQTGFVDVSDPFTMYVFDNNTLGISGSSYGIVFSQLFKVPPFAPSSAVVQLTSRTVALSGAGLTGTSSMVKFVGYRQSDDSIIFSDSTFIQSPTVCQLGVVLLKKSGLTTSFIDSGRTFINQPDIAAYSNLDTTSTGIKSNVIVDHLAADLRIKNTVGNLVGISVNWHGANNDLLPISANTSGGTIFTYLYPGLFTSAVTLTTTTLIDPTLYWNGSALVGVPAAGNTTIQRFLVTIRGTIVVQYGETLYTNYLQGQNNVWVQAFTDILPSGTFAEVGRLVVSKNCTDLSDNTRAAFYVLGSGGGSGGGGGSSVWGNITGNILDQTDLQSQFATKQNLLGYTAENITNKVDVISGSSSVEYPTENAVVNFVTTNINNSMSPIVKNEYIYTSGPQTFVTSQSFSQVWSVSVQGGGPLKADQYTLSASSAVTITDTLDSGDYIIILFTAISGLTPTSYTQSQVDALLNLKMDKQRQTKIVSTTTYTLIDTDSDKILYFTSSSAITMTIPSGLTLGNSYEVFQQGIGIVSFTGFGTTIRYSSQELPYTSERYSLVGIDSIANVTEEYHLYGQLYAI